MDALTHVLKVIGVILYRFISYTVQVLLIFSAIGFFLYLCIEYETFGKIVFSIFGLLIALALILVAVLYVCEVSDSIKRKKRFSK